MIRERLVGDLDPLCEVLATLGRPSAAASDKQRRDWLTGRDVVLAYVFDQAPVTVVPTRNVVGHVAVERPGSASAYGVGGELLAIVDLFVRPGPHQDGIARFLLTEAVAHVHRLGATAVLDLEHNVSLTRRLVERRGFEPVAGPGGAGGLFVRP